MKNCKEIENNLSLYLDDMLSGAEKLALEEHLKSCPHCSKVLAQLQKTGNLVSGLKDVEPPPWFKQKIMARVREEAEKKSLVKKWFYPLQVKIPVQVFATVFIAVLAVYIYRTGEDRMKAVIPSSAPAPVAEIQTDKLPEESQKAPETVTTGVMKEKVAADKAARNETAAMYDRSSGTTMSKEELKKELPQENVRVGALDAAKSIKGNIAPDVEDYKYANAPAAKSVKTMSEALEKKKDSHVSASAVKAGRTMQMQTIIPQSRIALYVVDINAAAGEVEKRLTKYGAKNIVREMPDDKIILTAEFKIQNMKDFIAQLKTIGLTKEIIMPSESTEGNVVAVIEILNK
jgi:hypothetical protein